MKNRTPDYWPTRVLLAVGFIPMVIVLPLSLEILTRTMYFSPDFLGVPAGIVVILAGLAMGVVGFAWMLRIFRGPRDEPPVWRYRDR
jgi:hypothetical protein